MNNAPHVSSEEITHMYQYASPTVDGPKVVVREAFHRFVGRIGAPSEVDSLLRSAAEAPTSLHPFGFAWEEPVALADVAGAIEERQAETTVVLAWIALDKARRSRRA